MSNNNTDEKGKLFLVANHIGNKKDLTFRAVESLQECNVVLCEDLKIGARTLHDINLKKDIELLNKTNEEEKSIEVIERLKNGEKFAILSDAGMPVFADPGQQLVNAAVNAEISVQVVPGVTSVMTALVRSGFNIEEFLYAGFLSRISSERERKIKFLSRERRTVALLETPFRLIQLLEAFSKIIPQRKAYIGMNLTMYNETHHYGTFQELYEKFKDNKSKVEFVICFEGDDTTPKKFDKPREKSNYNKNFKASESKSGFKRNNFNKYKDK